ncbi:MAG: hypothetical protein ACPGRD_05060 [Planktomarina sp.]
MALPLAPVAGLALKYGSVALVGAGIALAIPKLRRDQKAEDVLDHVDDGFAARRDHEQINLAGRYRRIVTIGRNGPMFAIEATALTRIRIKKVN